MKAINVIRTRLIIMAVLTILLWVFGLSSSITLPMVTYGVGAVIATLPLGTWE